MKTTFTAILILLTVQLTVSSQVSKTIEVATPGTLSSLLTESEKSTITHLTVTGSIDTRDIKTMRDEITLLEDLNLSNTTIVEYTGTEPGTALSGSETATYPANVFPLFGFSRNSSLKTIVLPESITKIDDQAFQLCTNLENVIAGNNLIEIGAQAFNYAKKLNNIILPESLKLIGDASFSGCIGLNSLHIPANVNEIRDGAFARDCIAFITVDTSNPYFSSIDGVLFNKNKTALIASPAIYESYTIPESVEIIETSAFYFNTVLKIATLPEGVQLLSYAAFDHCTSLEKIYCKAINPPQILENLVFRNISKTSCIIYVPIGSRNAYIAADGWGEFQNIVETDFTTTIQAGKYQKPVISTNNGRLYLHNVTSDMEVAVYNLTGQLISRFNTQQTNSIDLPKGIYLVKAGDYSHRIIIQ